jgi:hypothetical protein
MKISRKDLDEKNIRNHRAISRAIGIVNEETKIEIV